MKVINGILLGTAIAFSSSLYAGTHDTTSTSDATITKTVKKDFAQDKLLNPFDITVSTQNGVVNLSGSLDTDLQYKQAVTLAESTQGVEDVNADNLTVKDSKSPLADTYITAKIEGLLLQKSTLSKQDVKFMDVNVETTNGVVYLSGDVDNKDQIDNIISIAQSVDGVKSVKSDLKVKTGD